MAVPTLTMFDARNSAKVTGTALTGVTSGVFAVGDYLVGGLAMDPATGAVAFATGGTPTFGAWTVIQDASNGSGTAGVRTVLAYAKCTGAGNATLKSTFPSVACAAQEAFKLAGADGTTPVLESLSGAAASGSAVVFLFPPNTADVVALLFAGIEQASGATPASGLAFSGTGDTFVAVSRDATTLGTTGGGASSNITTANIIESCAALTTNSVTATSKFATLNEQIAVLFQAPAGAAAAVLPELVMAPSRGF